jgi:hypothetical protein
MAAEEDEGVLGSLDVVLVSSLGTAFKVDGRTRRFSAFMLL